MIWLAAAFAAELSGTLTGADGQPIVGATVYAYDVRFNYAAATTRSGGEWTLQGLPPGGYRLRFLPPNYDPHGDRFYGGAWDTCSAEVVQLPAESSVVAGVDEALETGASVTGRVVDLAGTPIGGMRVTAYGAEPRTGLIERNDTTDDDGRFAISGLDAEAAGSAFYVSVEGSGWPRQYAGPSYTEGESERGSFAAGVETDVGDVALLDGIRVSGVISGPDGAVAEGQVYVYSSQQILTETVGLDGAYAADGLPPGDVVVWASSPGLATTYYPGSDRPGGSYPVPDEGADATVDVSLPTESRLTLQALGEGSFDGVSVLVYNDTYTVGRGDQLTPEGEVSIGGLYAGNYYVYVYGQDAGFTSGFIVDGTGEPLVFQVDGATDLELPLERGAVLSGTVTDDRGEPVYGARVEAVETTGAQRQWTATTDRDGAYTIRGVDATTVTVDAAFYWYCPGDPGYATTWYEAARSADAAGVLLVNHGDVLDGLDLVLPVDDDHDGMGDDWERAHGLDPAHDDAAGDLDGDGFTNGEEWVLGTDPDAPDAVGAGGCGCGSGAANAGLLAIGAGLALRARRRHQT